MISIFTNFSIIENNIYMYIVGASSGAQIQVNISFQYFYVYNIAYFTLFWLWNPEILEILPINGRPIKSINRPISRFISYRGSTDTVTRSDIPNIAFNTPVFYASHRVHPCDMTYSDVKHIIDGAIVGRTLLTWYCFVRDHPNKTRLPRIKQGCYKGINITGSS